MNTQTKLKLEKGAPTVLSIVATIGVLTSVGLAIKQTPKALELIKEKEKKKGQKLEKKEIVKSAAPLYLPVLASCTATIICIWGINGLNKRSQASLISAYAMLDQKYKNYKDKVIDIYGKEGHDKIISELAKEHSDDGVIKLYGLYDSSTLDFGVDSPDDERLFYDTISMRYFTSTVSRVLQAEYHLNRNFILASGEVYVNEFYEFLGISKIPELEHHGWFVSDDMYWVDFNHSKTTLDDGLECLIIEAVQEPLLYNEWCKEHDDY